MKSFVYIEVSKEINFTYEKEFVLKVKEAIPDVETFDLDNHSDSAIITYTIDLIKKSDRSFLLFNAEKEASLGKLMILLEEVLKNKDKCSVKMIGANTTVSKYLRLLNPDESFIYKDLSSIKIYLETGSNA
jgi:hypothetical protein